MNIREEYLHLIKQRAENMHRTILDTQRELTILMNMVDKLGSLEEHSRKLDKINPSEELVKEYAGDQLLSPKETSQLLGIAMSTLDNWRCTGRQSNLPYIKMGKKIKYRYRDIIKYIEDSQKLHATYNNESNSFRQQHKSYSGTKSS